MSLLIKKIARGGTRSSVRRSSEPIPFPKRPPSPTLAHLTPEEISILNNVFRRQEEFEKQEEDRVKRLERDLRHLEGLVRHQSTRGARLKQVDLRLCRLCYMTKFADGIGRICHDCSRRVCNKCGSFTKLKWDPKKNRNVKGRWRCVLCQKRREYACVTGDWFHGRDAKPSLNNKVFQRKLNDIWSGAESDWGNMSAPDGYDYVQRCARTDTELLPAERSESPRSFRRSHRRRTYSEESYRCAEEEEEAELDGELFWLERQKCRRERLEMQKRSARRRSSTSVNKLEEDSAVSCETLPQRKNSSASYSNEKRPRRPSKSDTLSYMSPDCGPYGGESTAESGQEFCKVHGYRSHADLQTEARIRGKSISHGKVRRSSSDGEYLDQPSHAHITRFLRDEALESHSSDSVAVLSKDLSAEGLLNPHLSSFRKDTLSSEDVQRGKPTQTPYGSSYGSASSVFGEDGGSRSRSGTGDSRRTPQTRRGHTGRGSRPADKYPSEPYSNSPQMSWKTSSDRRESYERWQSHDSSRKGEHHRSDMGRRQASVIMDTSETRQKEVAESGRRTSMSEGISQRHSGSKDPVEIIVRRPSDIVEADSLTQRMSVLEAMESDRRRSCPTDYSEKGRRYSGTLDPGERPFRRKSAGTDGSDRVMRRPSGMVESPLGVKPPRSQPNTRSSWERLNRRHVGSCERLNRQHSALRDSSERLSRRTSSQADIGNSFTLTRQRSGDSDTTDPERRMSSGRDRRNPADPLRKSSSLGSEDSSNPHQENQRRHSYDPPRRPSVISVERKHSDPYRRYPTNTERRSSVERLQRSSPSSRELYDGDRRRPSIDRRDSRDSMVSRRDSRDQGRRHSRDLSKDSVNRKHSSSPGRSEPGERRRSSTTDRSGGLSKSRESMTSDRDSPRESPHTKHNSRRDENDKMRRISRRSSFSPFKVTFTVEKKEDGSCRTSSLGLRVVGGKTGSDGKLGAFVTHVAKGGAADKAGLRAGDQVLEWNGQRLVDATFEEAKRITDRSGYTVTITALRSRDQKSNELEREDSISIPHWHRESEVRRNLDTSRDQSGTRQLRRSLPRIPVEIVNKSSRLIAGRISLKLWLDWRTSKLHVTVLCAQGLLPREGPEKEMPQAFVKLYLLPNRNVSQHYRTDTMTGTADPEWNATYVFDDMSEEELCRRSLEVTMWDFFPHKPSLFLGEVLLDLNSANLENLFAWYPLSDHDENSAPLPTGSPKPRPRSSAPSILEKDVGHLAGAEAEERSPWASLPLLPATPAHDKVKELLHKRNLPSQKSLEGDSPGTADTSEPVAKDTSEYMATGLTHKIQRDLESNKLKKQSNKKKSSSQSSLSTTDDETKCRRESFRSKVRRRMSDVVTRVGAKLADRRSLSEDEASRRDYDSRGHSKSSRSQNNLSERYRANNLANSTSYAMTPPTALSTASSQSSGTLRHNSDSTDLEDGFLMFQNDEENHDFDSVLGVGQVAPRPNMRTTVQGDVLLGFMITKGHLEVDVLGARELSLNHANQPPDTYVKTCLMEGTKKIQRKKTRTIKGSTEPRYGHKIKYSALNVQGRYMRVQVKGRCGGFERNQCLGEVVVKLDRLDLSKHTRGWYKLFQHSVTDFGSAESL